MVTEGRSREIEWVASNLHDLERKDPLLYLTGKLRCLRREQVEALAGVIDADNQQGIIRPFAEVASTALLAGRGRRRFFQGDPLLDDPLLGHVALEYTHDSLHQPLNLEPITPDGHPNSPADYLAGDGSARPLLMGYYSLEGRGLIAVREDEDGHELFVPTPRGRDYALALGNAFDYIVNTMGQGNFLAVVSRFGTTVRAYQPTTRPSVLGLLLEEAKRALGLNLS